jgi:hypothetical protein
MKTGELRIYTPTEFKIHKIWCDVLHFNDFSTTDNFLFIGGNSFLAISVVKKIKETFNLNDKEFMIRHFFDSPRIKDLAEHVDLLLMFKKKSLVKQ